MKFSIPAGGARVERIITASRGPGIALCTAAQAADIATRRIGGSLEDAGNGRIDADGHDQRQRLRRDTAVHGRGRCSRRRWWQERGPAGRFADGRHGQTTAGSGRPQTPRRSTGDGGFLSDGQSTAQRHLSSGMALHSVRMEFWFKFGGCLGLWNRAIYRLNLTTF